MRRRGPGVGGIKKNNVIKTALKEKGAELQEDKIQHAEEIISTFKTQLEDFARKYKQQIRSDPYFRMQFQTMCEKIGVDPLASSKGVWGELLGFGDFYYELGVRIVEMCIVTRNSNGGLISLKELVKRLNIPTKPSISEDDIKRSVIRLKKLGGGFGLVSVGGTQMVASVPFELNRDHTEVLALADVNGGHISATQIASRESIQVNSGQAEGSIVGLGWQVDRAERALRVLSRDGLAWVDEQTPNQEKDYWFPSLWLGLKSETLD